MPGKTSREGKVNKLKKKHRFFQSPYRDYVFTKCPKCNTKTKIRKFPLVIHIEPQQLFLLNKQCRYCTRCDLIIAKQEEIEALMAARLSLEIPEIIGNEYLAIGTLDKKDWREGNRGGITSSELIDRMYVFEDVWDFNINPARWYPADKNFRQ